jgi:hypothetical protein
MVVLVVCVAAYGGAYLVLVQNSHLPCLPSEASHGCVHDYLEMVNYFGTATCNSGCPNNTDFAKWILVTS